jgi:protein ImuA
MKTGATQKGRAGGGRFADFNLGETPEFFEGLRKRFLGQFLLCAFPRALTPDRTQSKNKTGTRSEFVPVRNNVPGGENVGEFRTSGVERAGGAGGEGLIEHLRQRIRVLEQVPVSLAFPPAPDTGPLPRPACSLLFSPEAPSLGPLPPFGGARAPIALKQQSDSANTFGRAERGESQSQKSWFTPLPGVPIAQARWGAPPLPSKGGGGVRGEVTNTASPPLHKLAASGLHEIKASAYRDEPAALAFVLAFIGDRLVKRDGASPLLWCLTESAAREWGAPYGPGLISFGLDPALILIVQAGSALDAAWALEEGLKARAFTAALGQIEVKAPIIARRLGLAAQASRTPCLLLSGHQGGGLPGTLTRWRVAAERTSGAAFDASAPGPPAWHLTLERCRGMAPARSWTVEFRDVAYGFRLASRFADRAAEAGEERQALSG